MMFLLGMATGYIACFYRERAARRELIAEVWREFEKLHAAVEQSKISGPVDKNRLII